jgi:Effector protein
VIVKWFNNRIRVIGGKVDWKARKWTPMEDLSGEAAKSFVDYTCSLLAKLSSLHTGQQLLAEIATGNNRVTICLHGGGGNQTEPENEVIHADSYFRPFRHWENVENEVLKSYMKKIDMSVEECASVLLGAIKRSPFTQDMLARLVVNTNLLSDERYMRAHVSAVKLRRELIGRPNPAERSDWRDQYLQDCLDGKRPIRDDMYFKLCLYLHDWLETGKGVNTVVAYSASYQTACCESRAKLDHEAGSVPYIILGHELIHAWRRMTGRRIFEGGTGEEHMTTGLPPYTNMKFTENKLRVLGNLAVRDHYASASGDFSQLLGATWLNRQGRELLTKFWTNELSKPIPTKFDLGGAVLPDGPGS